MLVSIRTHWNRQISRKKISVLVTEGCLDLNQKNHCKIIQKKATTPARCLGTAVKEARKVGLKKKSFQSETIHCTIKRKQIDCAN